MHILISASLPTVVGIALGDIFQMRTLGLSDISGLAVMELVMLESGFHL